MNKKHFAILGAAGVLLFGCSSASAFGEIRHTQQNFKGVSNGNSVLMHAIQIEKQRQLDLKKIAKEMAMQKNKDAIAKRISKLKGYVGKTWYVFSGSSPSGWDCSGLTRWFYEGLGITIDHSASKQAKNAGIHVTKPKIGDIVAFSHLNSEKYYHVGIYVGDNKIIHAKKPGTKTELVSLTDDWFAKSEISFVRVLEN